MSVTLTVRDETTGGDTTHELTLDFMTERITVRELIRSRVYQEVKDYNLKAAQTPVFRGLVEPGDAERVLNGVRLKKPRQIDWQKQLKTAIESFERNGLLILVDDRQVVRLDEELEIRPETMVSFLKLVPLVGG